MSHQPVRAATDSVSWTGSEAGFGYDVFLAEYPDDLGCGFPEAEIRGLGEFIRGKAKQGFSA